MALRYYPFYHLLLVFLFNSCTTANKNPPSLSELQTNSQGLYPDYIASTYKTGTPGYYFLTTYKIGNYDYLKTGYNLIIDPDGQVVYFKHTGKSFDFKIQPSGLMSYFERNKFYVLDSSFTIVDSVSGKNGVEIDLHDFQILANGNYLTIGSEKIKMDLSSYKLFRYKKIAGSRNAIVTSGVIQEIDTAGKLVFEWHAKDHYKFDDADEFYLNDTAALNWTHFNTIEPDSDGNLLLTVRNFNEVTKIDRNNGSILWRMGGKRNQFRFLDDPFPFMGMHDARKHANNCLTLYDNGHSDDKRKHISRACKYIVDEKNKTAKLAWSYETGVKSSARGNLQLLPDGGFLVNLGEVKNGNKTFLTLSPKGEQDFSLHFADTLGAYRAFKYYKLPWKINRPTITCNCDSARVFLTASGGHTKYIWSNGTREQKVEIMEPGVYTVFAALNDGGFMQSEPFSVKDLKLICNKTSGK